MTLGLCVTRASRLMHRRRVHRRGLTSLLDSHTRAPPPPQSWHPPPFDPDTRHPPPFDPDTRHPRPFDPDTRYPRPFDPDTRHPPPFDPDTRYPPPFVPDTRHPPPFDPDTRYPRSFDPDTRYPPPLIPPSYPYIRQPRPLNPPLPFPYPKLRRPTEPVPSVSDPEPLPPLFGWPIYTDPPTSLPKPLPPKPRRPMYSDPPTSLPKPPKPSLAAQPAAVVTPGINVTLTCRAPQPAWKFVLTSGAGAPVQYQYPELARNPVQARFFLEAVTEAQGGSYRCEYHNRGWSHPSDALELMVTDLLPRPTLEALPGPRAPGAPVSLRCTGRARNMSFALYREGEATPMQFRGSEQPWADFPLPRAQAPGTYTCYYHTPAAPYVLSPRSEPLVVSLEGSGSVDYTKGNVARLALAGLVLLSLAALLGWEWRSGRRASDRSPGGLELDPAA
ncbi:osteoclast-associated immunoglobulin-like receptor isoform X2 [Eptesicus fuscus]|uniref:osteoclast-associated immunoglobulin-like receptor isoform X2 n=1 Tax=Eptesicus fuscus TaxID=29078 RepID=UPI002403A413|nr:osteoclast-associated immunoglobulin-like receptor isoform X2 [Eptesicus fuscus]